MTPRADDPLAGYDDCYRKSERIEIPPERFRRGVARGDDGAWGVGALVVDGDRVLFVREGDTWLLPGGRLEADESPEEGARREVREETGIDVELVELGAVAEQTFVDRDTGDSYGFRFATFVGRPAGSAADPVAEPDDPAIDEAAWKGSVPEEAFDRELVVRLFGTYV